LVQQALQGLSQPVPEMFHPILSKIGREVEEAERRDLHQAGDKWKIFLQVFLLISYEEPISRDLHQADLEAQSALKNANILMDNAAK
jgi:hypothetical protein